MAQSVDLLGRADPRRLRRRWTVQIGVQTETEGRRGLLRLLIVNDEEPNVNIRIPCVVGAKRKEEHYVDIMHMLGGRSTAC